MHVHFKSVLSSISLAIMHNFSHFLSMIMHIHVVVLHMHAQLQTWAASSLSLLCWYLCSAF